MARETNDSSYSSNDEFKKFLNEPVSTTDSEISNILQHTSPVGVLDKKDDTKQEPGHQWLKKPQSKAPTSQEAPSQEANVTFTLKKQDPESESSIENEASNANLTNTELNGRLIALSSSKDISVSSKDETSPEQENSSVDYSSVFESEADGETLKEDRDANSPLSNDERSSSDRDEKTASGTTSDIPDKKSDVLDERISSNEDEKSVSDTESTSDVDVKNAPQLQEDVTSSSNQGKQKDLSFFEMVMHSEKAENEIIQELSIDSKLLPTVSQESTDSSDSEKIFFGLDLEKEKVSSEPSLGEKLGDISNVIKDTVCDDDIEQKMQEKVTTASETDRELLKSTITRIPTPIKITANKKSVSERGKSVTFSRGILSASEQKLEKEIDELKKELEEQEQLIEGYQRENEKLYSQLKHEKKAGHISDTKWRIETEKLRMEVGKLREQTKISNLGLRKANSSRQRDNDEQHSNNFRKLKEEAELEKKKVKTLQEKMTSFENHVEELSNDNKALAKEKLELLEKNTILEAQLQEMETICAKWKLEATEAKQREKDFQHATNKEVQEKMLADHLQIQKRKYLQELKEKDVNTKSALDELGKQYNLLKQRYQKHLEETEIEEMTCKKEMDSKMEALKKKLQETEKKLEKRKLHDPSKLKTVGVQVGSSGNDLEKKEMKLKLERLTLQLEDLETKYEQLRDSKSKEGMVIKRNHIHHDIIKRNGKEEKSHSTAIVHLRNRVENLEILTNHLSFLLKENERKSLLLANENFALKRTIEDLTTTQKDNSTERKTFFQIEKKILDLQKWHGRREVNLREAMARSSCNCSNEFHSEVTKWQQRVVEKNQEIDYYSKELDRITERLRQLQNSS